MTTPQQDFKNLLNQIHEAIPDMPWLRKTGKKEEPKSSEPVKRTATGAPIHTTSGPASGKYKKGDKVFAVVILSRSMFGPTEKKPSYTDCDQGRDRLKEILKQAGIDPSYADDVYNQGYDDTSYNVEDEDTAKEHADALSPILGNSRDPNYGDVGPVSVERHVQTGDTTGEDENDEEYERYDPLDN